MTEPEEGAGARTAVLGPGLPGSPGRFPELARQDPARRARHSAAYAARRSGSSFALLGFVRVDPEPHGSAVGTGRTTTCRPRAVVMIGSAMAQHDGSDLRLDLFLDHGREPDVPRSTTDLLPC